MVEEEVKNVIQEKNGFLLVRIDSVVNMGDHKYKGLRYEMWTDREKFEQDISEEYIDGQQYIYCSGFAGSSEDEVTRVFGRRSSSKDTY